MHLEDMYMSSNSTNEPQMRSGGWRAEVFRNRDPIRVVLFSDDYERTFIQLDVGEMPVCHGWWHLAPIPWVEEWRQWLDFHGVRR